MYRDPDHRNLLESSMTEDPNCSSHICRSLYQWHMISDWTSSLHQWIWYRVTMISAYLSPATLRIHALKVHPNDECRVQWVWYSLADNCELFFFSTSSKGSNFYGMICFHIYRISSETADSTVLVESTKVSQGAPPRLRSGLRFLDGGWLWKIPLRGYSPQIWCSLLAWHSYMRWFKKQS